MAEPDYESMSDQELMAIAGISPGGDIGGVGPGMPTPTSDPYESLSNEDLFRIAGISPPVAMGPPKGDWNFLDSAKNFGSGVVEGVTGLAGLAGDLFQSPMDKYAMNMQRKVGDIAQAIQGGASEQQIEAIKNQSGSFFPISQKVDEAVSPYLAEKDPQYRYARTLGNFAAPVPVKGMNTLSSLETLAASLFTGAGSQVAIDLADGTSLEPYAGVAGALLTAKGGSKALDTLSGLDTSAKSYERFALGVRPSDYQRSAKNRGLTGNEASGELESSIKSAFDDVISRDTFKGAKGADGFYEANEKAIDSLATKLSAELETVDKIKGASNPIYPTFDIAREYALRYTPTPDLPAALKYIDEYEAALKSTDGSLAALQREKIALSRKVYGGRDVGKENIDKYIQSDLRQTIEDQSKMFLGEAPDEIGKIRELNAQLGNHLEIKPILNRQIGKDEGGSATDTVWKSLFTTGGGNVIGPSALAGIYSSGDLGAMIAGGAVGAATKYATTPGAALKISKGLQNIASLSDRFSPGLQQREQLAARALANSLNESRDENLDNSYQIAPAQDVERQAIISQQQPTTLESSDGGSSSLSESRLSELLSSLMTRLSPEKMSRPQSNEKEGRITPGQEGVLEERVNRGPLIGARPPSPNSKASPELSKPEKYSAIADLFSIPDADATEFNAGSLFSKGNMEDIKAPVKEEDVFKGKPAKAVLQAVKADPVDHAIALLESGLDPDAKNPKSTAKGLFQLLDGTAKSLGVKDSLDPGDNYDGYLKLKAEAVKAFKNDTPQMIYANHYLGQTVLRKWLNGKPLSSKEEAQVKELETVLIPRLTKIYNRLVQEKRSIEA